MTLSSHDKFVLHEECEVNHKLTRMFYTFMCVCGALFVSVAVWSVTQGWLARCEAADAKQVFAVHEAHSWEKDIYLNKTLDRLEKAIEDLTKETKKLTSRNPQP